MAHPKKIDFYQWMKILFHFLSFVFLIYLAFSIKSLGIFSKLALIIIAFFKFCVFNLFGIFN